MARLLISATRKSSGKTTLTVGLTAALVARGVAVHPFKKGPDYIDPLWLGRAARRPCRNLDFNTQTPREMRDDVALAETVGGLALIEGNLGLFDGMDVAGSDSNDALARMLGAPVVLVVDAEGMSRGVAALLQGYQTFAGDLPFAGVILNKVGGGGHETKLRAAIERYTEMPVLGAVPRGAVPIIEERHLGLVPANETRAAESLVARLGETVAAYVDVAAVQAAAETAPVMPRPATPVAPPPPADVTIAYLRDGAFGFYYADDLVAFSRAGARLAAVDSLTDPGLPGAIDGLFIGGGFPETHMETLAANRPLMEGLRAAVHGGLPVYAECGGLMVLARTLRQGDRVVPMAGALPLHVAMDQKPHGRGLVRMTPTEAAPWAPVAAGTDMPAHEFHYSRVVAVDRPLTTAYTLGRGFGLDGGRDGVAVRNTVANYAHLRHTAATPWVDAFVQFVRTCQRPRLMG